MKDETWGVTWQIVGINPKVSQVATLVTIILCAVSSFILGI